MVFPKRKKKEKRIATLEMNRKFFLIVILEEFSIIEMHAVKTGFPCSEIIQTSTAKLILPSTEETQ